MKRFNQYIDRKEYSSWKEGDIVKILKSVIVPGFDNQYSKVYIGKEGQIKTIRNPGANDEFVQIFVPDEMVMIWIDKKHLVNLTDRQRKIKEILK